MNLKKNELRVYYSTHGLNTDLEKQIRDLLKKFGYHEWASGTDLETGVRDLAFDKENK